MTSGISPVGKGRNMMDCADSKDRGQAATQPGQDGGVVGRALAYVFEWFDSDCNGWYGFIQRLLDGLTPEQALWKPAPERHNIWQIVRHITFWRRYMIARLEQAPLPDPETGDWSDPPATDEAAWKAELEEYYRNQARFVEVINSCGAAGASQLDDAAAEERGAQVFHSAYGLLSHDSYHAGQIAYLRAMQGFPPV